MYKLYLIDIVAIAKLIVVFAAVAQSFRDTALFLQVLHSMRVPSRGLTAAQNSVRPIATCDIAAMEEILGILKKVNIPCCSCVKPAVGRAQGGPTHCSLATTLQTISTGSRTEELVNHYLITFMARSNGHMLKIHMSY